MYEKAGTWSKAHSVGQQPATTRSILVLLLLVGSDLLQAQANSYSATWSAGDILADKTFLALPGQSICPASMTLPVPAGETIDSTRVSYTYFSSLAGFGGPFQQLSQLRCTTTGQSETQLALCATCFGTTEQYARTVHLADGLSSGSVSFELHLGTTGMWGSNCTNYHFVQNGTWTLTVYTSGGTTAVGSVPVDANVGAPSVIGAGEPILFRLPPDRPTMRLDVFDVHGRVHLSTQVSTGARPLSLPVAGTYLFRFSDGHGVILRRVQVR